MVNDTAILLLVLSIKWWTRAENDQRVTCNDVCPIASAVAHRRLLLEERRRLPNVSPGATSTNKNVRSSPFSTHRFPLHLLLLELMLPRETWEVIRMPSCIATRLETLSDLCYYHGVRDHGTVVAVAEYERLPNGAVSLSSPPPTPQVRAAKEARVENHGA
jgi:hypothetical protein